MPIQLEDNIKCPKLFFIYITSKVNNMYKRIIIRATFTLCMALFANESFAQGPNNSGTYYQKADGQKGSSLKTALADIISNHTTISYDGLLDAYKTTDKRSDGKVWDMYSNTTNFTFDKDKAGNYKKEGDVYNREHSVPQSWFSKESPMKSDLVHVVPTDGYVNNRRGNYPFGETNGEKYKSNNGFSKLGASTISGYSGIVFEPNDIYKGDFARIYFYMATCYENKISGWSGDMFNKTKYPAFKTWALDMLLKWSKEDPVSQKEIDRNKGVYQLQKNRNPFVDYPGLEEYIWGSKKDVAFSYDQYDAPTLIELPVQDINITDVYTITGIKVRSKVDKSRATENLKPGIYIINRKKVIVNP